MRRCRRRSACVPSDVRTRALRSCPRSDGLWRSASPGCGNPSRSYFASDQPPERIEVTLVFEMPAFFGELSGCFAAEDRIDERVELAREFVPLRIEVGQRDA